jgi:hypothetical protein
VDFALCATQNSLGSPDGLFITASPVCWVVHAVPQTAFCFIQNAMTGFIACVFLYRRRVSLPEAFAKGLSRVKGNFRARF